ncbi:hypothetical protein Tco_1376279 [Tanacetum coccineum]
MRKERTTNPSPCVEKGIYSALATLRRLRAFNMDQAQVLLGLKPAPHLHPELPGRDDTIQSISEGKIGIYTLFIEFANFRIPLSKFLLYVLQYYQINFSQLPVLAAAKISHFEIMCRVIGHQPSLGTFRIFYVNSYSNDVYVKRDPLPSDDLVDLPLLDKLNDNRTCIRKYPETFLCLVGLRRSFVDIDPRPTLLDMGLLDFVKSTDPFKVKTRERTLADGEVPLLIETTDMVVAPSDQTVCLVSHTIADEIKEHAGKKKRKVGFSADELPVKKVRSGAGSVPHPIEEFVSSSVTPTSEPEGYEDAGLPHDGNSRTRRASERYVILTSSSKHEDADTIVSPKTTSPKVDYPNPHMQMGVEDVDASVVNEIVNTFLPENDVDAASLPGNGAGASSLPKNGAGTSSSAPNDGNLIDHMPPPGFWASLRNHHDADFLDLLIVNSAQYAYIASELRLRYEHEIYKREILGGG